MRTQSALVAAAGLVSGALMVGSFSSTSAARVIVPDPALAAAAEANSGLVKVQSVRQRREIQDFLKRYEFGDPDYVQKERPSVFVEACRKEKKYLLMFSSDGDYFGRRHLGACPKPIRVVPLQDLQYWLEDNSYTDIRFTDRTAPDRVAEACLNGRHYTIRFDAAGKAKPRRNWFSGKCNKDDNRGDNEGTNDLDKPDLTMSQDSMTNSLRRRGYRRVRFDKYFDESKLAEACMGLRKYRLFLDGRARVKARRAVGFCRVPQRFADMTPPRPDLESIDTESNSRLEAETCQEILNWLQFRTPIIFESASGRIREESRPLLETIAQSVDRCPRTNLRIEGHTDSIGPKRFNRRLSQERADAVRRFLVRRGMPNRRVQVKGYGEQYPVTGNLTEEDRARNRRIDLILEWGRREDLRLARVSDDRE